MSNSAINYIIDACTNFTFSDGLGTFTNTLSGVGCLFASGAVSLAVNWAGHKVLKEFDLEKNKVASTAVKVSAFVLGTGLSLYLAPHLLVTFTAEKLIPGAIVSIFGITSFVFFGGLLGYIGNTSLAAIGMVGAGLGLCPDPRTCRC